MSLPTPEQFLAKLAASPADAAAFDRATRRERPHCTTRRQAVESTLEAVKATLAATLALKQKLAASRAKAAALEVARTAATNSITMTSPARPPQNPPASPYPPAPDPFKDRPSGRPVTAAQYELLKPIMTRPEFLKLTESSKLRFIKEGGNLIDPPLQKVTQKY